MQDTPTFEGRQLPNPDEEVFDQGLGFDIGTLVTRRRALGLLGAGVGALALAACGSDSTGSAVTTDSTASTTGSTTGSTTESTTGSTSGSAPGSTSAPSGDACATLIPEETAGPYPGDGTNGPDVLNQSGVVRSDITTSFGDLTGTAEGIPLEISLTVQDSDNGCVPYAGAAVYIWHCDRGGLYSLYSQGATDQNYLRGVQEADADGVVTFTSIFPACYPGRWPHIHFEVFPDLAAATDAGNKIATSQIALPEDVCNEVFATDGYEQSVRNMSQLTLASDNVFSDDGGVSQIGSMSGSVGNGLAVSLTAAVSSSSTPVSGDAPGGGPGGAPPGGGPGGMPPGGAPSTGNTDI